MDWLGWLTFGFVATAVLTAILVGAQLAHQTDAGHALHG